MTRAVPLASSLRVVARSRGDLRVAHPVLLGLKVESVELSPDALLEPLVEVGPVVHPLLDELALRAGLQRTGLRSYSGAARKVEPEALGRLLRALPGRSLVGPLGLKADASRPKVVKELKALLDASPLTKDLELDLSGRARLAPGVLVLLRPGSPFRLDLVTADWSGDLELDLFTARRVEPRAHLDALSALEVLDKALLRGLGAVDVSRPSRFAELEDLLESSLVARLVPGCPGRAELRAGSSTTLTTRTVAPVAAMSAVSSSHLSMPVAVDPELLDVTDMALAAPEGRAGLRVYQDHFCSTYAATTRGAALTLDPGMGKTVAAAVALEESSHPAYRALVVVPAGIRDQWARELAVWAPSLSVTVLRGGADLAAWPSAGPGAALVSPELLVREVESFTARTYDDLVIDEARLTPGTPRTKALEAVRARARRAMVLTGTPSERAATDLAALAAFVRLDPRIGEAPRDLDDLGPVVFRRSLEDAADVPTSSSTTPLLTPLPGEADLLEALVLALKERAADLRAARAARRDVASARARLSSALGLLRAAASDPRNVTRSSSSLARDLAERGLVSTRSARRDWVLDLAAGVKADGGQVLVCTDFLGGAEALGLAAPTRGLRASALTGSLGHLERTMSSAAFLSGDLDLLVVSASSQRGLNLQSATHVVHLDLPTTSASVLQRVGRAVRVGSTRTHVDVLAPHYAGLEAQLVAGLGDALAGRAEPSATLLATEAAMLAAVDAL